MDNLSSRLQSFLVRMGYSPESVSHDTAHAIEHLLRLLNPEDEDAVIHYYGLFGAERMALDELARERGLCPEDMMAAIDGCIRRIAVTPEWQEIKNRTK